MLRRVFVTLLCASANAVAAPHEIRGTVFDRATNTPIEGAIVMADHTSYATGTDGAYRLSVEAGEQLVITAPGYGLRTIAATDGLEILLRVVGDETIEITGKAPDQPHAQAYVLSSDDIRILPGSGNDMLRAAQALPGVARLPYSFGGLVLRGSSPRDNAVYLDGIEVPLAFHFGGLTSFYPSGMLANLKLENGGFDASYGRAQGGLVTLETREPRRDRWRVGGAVGLLDSAVFAEGPISDGGLLLGVRRSYFDVIAGTWAPDDVPLPSYLDAQVRMSFGDPTQVGRVTPLIFLAYDHVTARSRDAAGQQDSSTLNSFFLRAGVPYVRQWHALTLRIVPWLGLDQLTFTSDKQGAVETFARPKYPAGVRAELARTATWGELRGGIDAEADYVSHYEKGLGNPGDVLHQTNGDTTLAWIDFALWGEARWEVAKERLSAKPGLRIEHYGLSNEEVLDPRLAIREVLTDHLVLRETLGRFHQPPTPGDVDPHGGNPDLRSSYFDQAAVGVDGDYRGWSGTVTGFYNLGNELGVRDLDATGEFSNLGGLGPTFELLLEKQLGLAFYRQNRGRARNRGVEVLLRRTTERGLAMISYTLSSAERDDPQLLRSLLHPEDDRGFRPFELEQRHNLNLIVSRRWARWRLGARLQLVSGTPYTTIATTTNPNPARSSENLPMFFQLDLRADRTWQREWGTITCYADLQNATNYHNVESRQVVDQASPEHPNGYSDLPGLPIAPFLGVELVPR